MPQRSAPRRRGATAILAHAKAMMEDVPLGMMLLDAKMRPLWFNGEAAVVCAVWNHGERRAAALRARAFFRVPSALVTACRSLKTPGAETESSQVSETTSPHMRLVSDDTRGLYARIKQHGGNGSGLPVAYHIQLDYRRPRADRHRAVSPQALALLARLTTQEREVAIRLREGLRNREIAEQLHRSPLTIKAQITAIFSKIGVENRARLVALLNR